MFFKKRLHKGSDIGAEAWRMSRSFPSRGEGKGIPHAEEPGPRQGG